MAFKKCLNEICGTVLALSALLSTASAVDCQGKSFRCVNSTHFMICVDLGGGVSQSIDDFLIPCPPPTVCQGSNHFECEFPAPTTPIPTTNVIIETTQPWEDVAVTTNSPQKKTTKEYSEKYINTESLMSLAESFTTDATVDYTTEVAPASMTDANSQSYKTETVPATTESTFYDTTTVPAITESAFNDTTTRPAIIEAAFYNTTTAPAITEAAFNDTTTRPAIIEAAFYNTTTAPAITEAAFNDTTTAPAIIEAAFNDTTTTPAVTEAAFNDITAVPAITEATVNDTTTAPAITEAAFYDTITVPSTAEAAFNDTTTTPAVTESAFNDTTTRPAIIEAAFYNTTTAPAITEAAFNDTITAPAIIEAAFYDTAPAITEAAFYDTTTAPSVKEAAFKDTTTVPAMTESAFNDTTTATVIIEAAFHDTTTAPAITEATFNDTTTAPAIIEAAFNDTTTTPAVTEAAFNDTTAVPAITEATFNDTTTAPAITEAAFYDTITVPSTAEAAFNDTTTTPAVTESAFNDTTTRPAIIEAAFYNTTTAPAITEAAFNDTITAPAIIEAAFYDTTTAPAITEAAFYDTTTAPSVKEAAFKDTTTVPAMTESAFNDTTTAPVIIEAAFHDTTPAPAITEATFNDTTTAPAIIEAAFNDTTTTPAVTEAAFNDTTAVPAITEATFNDTTTAPTIIEAAFYETTTAPAITESAFNDTTTRPAIIEAAFYNTTTAPAITEAAFNDTTTAPAIIEAAFNDTTTTLAVTEAAFNDITAVPAITEATFNDTTTAPAIIEAAFYETTTAPAITEATFNDTNTAPAITEAAFYDTTTAPAITDAAFYDTTTAPVITEATFNATTTAPAITEAAFYDTTTAPAITEAAFNDTTTAPAITKPVFYDTSFVPATTESQLYDTKPGFDQVSQTAAINVVAGVTEVTTEIPSAPEFSTYGTTETAASYTVTSVGSSSQGNISVKTKNDNDMMIDTENVNITLNVTSSSAQETTGTNLLGVDVISTTEKISTKEVNILPTDQLGEVNAKNTTTLTTTDSSVDKKSVTTTPLTTAKTVAEGIITTDTTVYSNTEQSVFNTDQLPITVDTVFSFDAVTFKQNVVDITSTTDKLNLSDSSVTETSSVTTNNKDIQTNNNIINNTETPSPADSKVQVQLSLNDEKAFITEIPTMLNNETSWNSKNNYTTNNTQTVTKQINKNADGALTNKIGLTNKTESFGAELPKAIVKLPTEKNTSTNNNTNIMPDSVITQAIVSTEQPVHVTTDDIFQYTTVSSLTSATEEPILLNFKGDGLITTETLNINESNTLEESNKEIHIQKAVKQVVQEINPVLTDSGYTNNIVTVQLSTITFENTMTTETTEYLSKETSTIGIKETSDAIVETPVSTEQPSITTVQENIQTVGNDMYITESPIISTTSDQVAQNLINQNTVNQANALFINRDNFVTDVKANLATKNTIDYNINNAQKATIPISSKDGFVSSTGISDKFDVIETVPRTTTTYNDIVYNLPKDQSVTIANGIAEPEQENNPMFSSSTPSNLIRQAQVTKRVTLTFDGLREEPNINKLGTVSTSYTTTTTTGAPNEDKQEITLAPKILVGRDETKVISGFPNWQKPVTTYDSLVEREKPLSNIFDKIIIQSDDNEDKTVIKSLKDKVNANAIMETILNSSINYLNDLKHNTTAQATININEQQIANEHLINNETKLSVEKNNGLDLATKITEPKQEVTQASVIENSQFITINSNKQDDLQHEINNERGNVNQVTQTNSESSLGITLKNEIDLTKHNIWNTKENTHVTMDTAGMPNKGDIMKIEKISIDNTLPTVPSTQNTQYKSNLIGNKPDADKDIPSMSKQYQNNDINGNSKSSIKKDVVFTTITISPDSFSTFSTATENKNKGINPLENNIFDQLNEASTSDIFNDKPVTVSTNIESQISSDHSSQGNIDDKTSQDFIVIATANDDLLSRGTDSQAVDLEKTTPSAKEPTDYDVVTTETDYFGSNSAVFSNNAASLPIAQTATKTKLTILENVQNVFQKISSLFKIASKNSTQEVRSNSYNKIQTDTEVSSKPKEENINILSHNSFIPSSTNVIAVTKTSSTSQDSNFKVAPTPDNNVDDNGSKNRPSLTVTNLAHNIEMSVPTKTADVVSNNVDPSESMHAGVGLAVSEIIKEDKIMTVTEPVTAEVLTTQINESSGVVSTNQPNVHYTYNAEISKTKTTTKTYNPSTSSPITIITNTQNASQKDIGGIFKVKASSLHDPLESSHKFTIPISQPQIINPDKADTKVPQTTNYKETPALGHVTTTVGTAQNKISVTVTQPDDSTVKETDNVPQPTYITASLQENPAKADNTQTDLTIAVSKQIENTKQNIHEANDLGTNNVVSNSNIMNALINESQKIDTKVQQAQKNASVVAIRNKSHVIDSKSTLGPITAKNLVNSSTTTERRNASQPAINNVFSIAPHNTKNSSIAQETKIQQIASLNTSGQSKPAVVVNTDVPKIITPVRGTTQAPTKRITPKTVSPVSPNPKKQIANNSTINYTCINGVRGRHSDKDDCRKFYICIGNTEPIVGHCPVNTVFSDIKKLCTKNMSHCIRENEFKCPSGGRFRDAGKENVYYICVNHKNNLYRFKFQCQTGFTLNKTAVRCIQNKEIESNESLSTSVSENASDSSSNKISSTSSSSTSSKISSDSSSSTSSKSSSDSSTSSGSRSSNSGDSDSSSSKSKKRKEKPEDRDGDDDDEVFECEKEGKFPVRNDCRRYYLCKKNGKSQFRRKLKKCESGDVFHKSKKKCVDGDSYEC